MSNVSKGIAIVWAPTRLDGLRRRCGTLGQAQFLLAQARREDNGSRRSLGRSAARDQWLAQQAEFGEYQAEDAVYRSVLDRIEHRELDLGLPIRRVERSFLANFDFSSCAVVVVVGQDGLVANTAKYVGGLPIVAVNPDPQRIDGLLLPFRPDDVRRVVRLTLQERYQAQQVTLAEAVLNDGQRLLAFNDLFVGAGSHVSARYMLTTPDGSEPQSSSGIIVSTGAGSTGWLSSVFNMAFGMSKFVGGQFESPPTLTRDDRRIVWAVREPFVSKRSQAGLVAGWLDETQQMIVESMMPEGGVIFSDGVESDFLVFNSGTVAKIGVSQQRAQLVI